MATYQKRRKSRVGVNELTTLQLSSSYEWKPVLRVATRDCKSGISHGIVWCPAATLADGRKSADN